MISKFKVSKLATHTHNAQRTMGETIWKPNESRVGRAEDARSVHSLSFLFNKTRTHWGSEREEQALAGDQIEGKVQNQNKQNQQ